LILDEPTTALDILTQRAIIDVLRSLWGELHFAMLFISHDLSLAAELADRVANMYAGKVVELGGVREICFATLPDAGLRHDYGFAARLIAFAASKVLGTQQLRETLGALAHRADATARTAALTRLDEDIAALAAGRALVPALRSEFEACWLRHARRSEIHLTLAHFDALERGYDEALAWLDQQRSRYAAGDPVDAEVNSYAPPEFPILWEQGTAELRKLADLAGEDALPPNIREWLHRTDRS
jgi:ATPase subunit of ABC transporter with duplicated ATPase domains